MRTSLYALAVTAVAAAAIAACGGQSDSTSEPQGATEHAQGLVNISSGTVVRNAIIVDTRTGWLTGGMAVVIDQGKIKQILFSGLVTTSGSAKVVDGNGKYLVPGYLDMHTHSVPAAFGASPHWPLMLANGITGIRDMAGAPPLLAAAQQFNAARAAGALDAPEVLQMPGSPVVGAFSAADGVAAVQQTKAMGGAFVKVINAFPAAEYAILAEAKTQGLNVAGHLSVGVSAVDTVNAGWYSLEHLGAGLGIQLDCSTNQAAIRNALLTGQGTRPPFPPTYTVSPFLYSALDAPFYQSSADTYSDATCQNVAKTIAQKGTWQVPTMIRLHTMLQSDSASFSNDPNLKYVDPTTRGLWAQLGQEFAVMQPASAATTFRNLYPEYVKVLKLLRKYGGAQSVLTGTDTGGIWVIPGFALHQEFRELASAGFTPLEVLQATTLNGARHLNRESTMGTVEANKNADLVLLEANPLLNVANLSKIAGVFNSGKYFSKADLEAMKAAVAAANAAAPLRDVSTVLDTSHTH